jgi:class 3 adenylate cyclase
MSATPRLLTVFYADVADFSHLTGVDQEVTRQRVMTVLDHATEAIFTALDAVLRYSGAAILASFPSVVREIDKIDDSERCIERAPALDPAFSRNGKPPALAGGCSHRRSSTRGYRLIDASNTVM